MKTFHCVVLTICLAATLVCKAEDENAAQVRIELAQKAERELRDNILPFWLKHAPDSTTGGFQGWVDGDLRPQSSAPRGALLTSRILWTFSAAHQQHAEARCLAMAKRAYADLLGRFWDKQHGGLFWTIDAKGEPANTTKQIYGQVFGIFALSEFYRATNEPAALERAIELYRLVEKHGRDPVNGGYFEVFSRDWKRERSGKSVINPSAAKSQNTHLHVMEAYTNLLRVWPDAGLKADLRALLSVMLTRIYDSRTRHLTLFLTDSWAPRSDRFSYGHDIEAAWLMHQAAEVLGDAALLERTRKVAVDIAAVTLAEGVDVDGGLFNEGGPRGPSDRKKDWWPQAEAVVGFLDVYQISGDKRFLAAAVKTWNFIESRLVDRDKGEWFETVSGKREVERRPKISLWKCPYHNGRACMEIVRRAGTPEKSEPHP